MAKGQKRPERAMPREPKLHTENKSWIKNKTNKHKTKLCQKLSKLIIIINKTWVKFVSKVLSSFAVF